MNWKDDPKVLDFVRSQKHGSATIDNDVGQAFDDAETFEEFKQNVRNDMEKLSNEAVGIAHDVGEIELAAPEETKTSPVSPEDLKALLKSTLEQIYNEVTALRDSIDDEIKKLRKVYVIVELHGGVPEEVRVYTDEGKAEEHYAKFIQKHYKSEEDYLNQLEHAMPKDEIHQYEAELE